MRNVNRYFLFRAIFIRPLVFGRGVQSLMFLDSYFAHGFKVLTPASGVTLGLR